MKRTTCDVSEKGAALRAAAEGRFGELPIYDKETECASREEIRALQLAKLIKQVEWTYEHVAYYRERMDEMGVAPADIKTLEDIRKLPFTDKKALRDTLKIFASSPSRTRRRFAIRFPSACSPFRSKRSWSFTPRRVRRESPWWSAIPSKTWPFGPSASPCSFRWRASFPATLRRWRSATACSQAVSGFTTVCRNSVAR